jgi:hypothetical protein
MSPTAPLGVARAGAATIRRDPIHEVGQLQRLAEARLPGHRRENPPSGPSGLSCGVEKHA